MDCAASPLALRCAPGCFASSSLRSVRTNFHFVQATPSLFRVGTPQRSRKLGALCARIRAPSPPDTKNPAEAGLFVSGGEGGMDCAASPLALRCAPGCFASSSLRSVRTNFHFAQATPSLFRVGTPQRSRKLGALCARIRAPSPPDTKNPAEAGLFVSGGEGGIRTPGRLQTFNGFQDRRIRPLCHLSM